GLLALLAVGERASERPFDPDEEQFLAAAASAGALALENLLLRSSQASSAGPSHAGRPTDAIEAPEAARLSRRCRRLFPSDAGSACPDDETFFETVPAPYLLAGKYRLERWVGAGGMGVVYKARDLALARDVAVKTLPSVASGSARRLQREARAAAQLIHPSLGLIFALESWHGTPMLVLEYLPGGTLADRIRGGPVAPALASAWGAALASGLEALHARGVLHRDLKPSNVGFAADGTPKLLDFGLVRLLGETDASFAPGVPLDLRGARGETDSATRTAASHVVGTVPYLSPEALQGRPPSAGFDLWGLSVTIYEALTGVNPFAASSSTRTAERVLALPVPDPRGYRPDCPEPLAAVLLAALARDERVRPATARALREAFEGAGRGLPSTFGESTSLRARGETFPGPAPTA
ncbi:MAG TPA: serine/threonine-protein kinase, partial [Thermoanaerobaculia bacterium]|nr:serine/threonine-protein kinase [Thermoanaerobaculia bacterium]